MKKLMVLVAAIVALSGCENNTASTNANPSLSPNTRPTSRTPSPGNIQKTNVQQASTMAPPGQ